MNPLQRNDNERRSGRSTRLADIYIQQLFDSETINIMGSVKVVDHHWGDSIQDSMKASIRLMQIIVRRLAMEHGNVIVTTDEKNLIISIKSK